MNFVTNYRISIQYDNSFAMWYSYRIDLVPSMYDLHLKWLGTGRTSEYNLFDWFTIVDQEPVKYFCTKFRYWVSISLFLTLQLAVAVQERGKFFHKEILAVCKYFLMEELSTCQRSPRSYSTLRIFYKLNFSLPWIRLFLSIFTYVSV